jgi:hypothetical protein
MNHAFIIASFLIIAACEPVAEDAFTRNFIIPKGEHYAEGRTVELLHSDVLSFTAVFDKSAVYKFSEEIYQDSKNKLLGFSDCNSSHHENSARFAWQYYNDELQIYAYCYVNGERVEKYVGVAGIGEENHFEISVNRRSYTFIMNQNEPVTIERGNTCDKGAYYMLWPYFGGSKPAPHDVRIDIRIHP